MAPSPPDDLFQATFEEAAVGIAHVAPDGRWLRVNRMMAEITGYPPEELLGGSFQQITHADDLSLDVAQAERLLRGEIERYVMDKRYVRKDGSTVWVSLTGTLIRRGSGEPHFFVAVVQDISERKRIEAARLESEERLTALRNDYAHLARVNEMGEMAAAIAHEINQPLTAIVNYLNTALYVSRDAGAPDAIEETRSLMTAAGDQALRAGEIVRRLREFVGKGSGERRVREIGPLIQSAARLALIDAPTHGITVEMRIATGNARIAADAVQIQQVLVNILRNAVEALSAQVDGHERKLTVSSRRLSGAREIEIQVEDTGPGIAPSVSGRLFEAFVTSKPAGMGIGLSVCRRLVEAHGGTVRLDPRAGGGAVATLVLPGLPDPV